MSIRLSALHSYSLQKHVLYNPKNIKIFQTDITTENCFCEVDYSVNIVTLIFVLSAINPTNFRT